jgi:hypothetical protein
VARDIWLPTFRESITPTFLSVNFENPTVAFADRIGT